jgi:hypothetical protein
VIAECRPLMQTPEFKNRNRVLSTRLWNSYNLSYTSRTKTFLLLEIRFVCFRFQNVYLHWKNIFPCCTFRISHFPLYTLIFLAFKEYVSPWNHNATVTRRITFELTLDGTCI